MKWKKIAYGICMTVITIFGAVMVNKVNSYNGKHTILDVAVIGGADGPTKIFVVSNGISILEISVSIFLLLGLTFIILRKKKEL